MDIVTTQRCGPPGGINGREVGKVGKAGESQVIQVVECLV